MSVSSVVDSREVKGVSKDKPKVKLHFRSLGATDNAPTSTRHFPAPCLEISRLLLQYRSGRASNLHQQLDCCSPHVSARAVPHLPATPAANTRPPCVEHAGSALPRACGRSPCPRNGRKLERRQSATRARIRAGQEGERYHTTPLTEANPPTRSCDRVSSACALPPPGAVLRPKRARQVATRQTGHAVYSCPEGGLAANSARWRH